MRLNKKLFGKSLYKISTILFLVGYNFIPVALAAEDISNLDTEIDQSVLVTTEEDTEVPIDTSEDILEEGISDPEEIAKPTVWRKNGGKYVTTSSVVVNEKYEFPENSDVSVTFTKLPDNASTLSIEEIILTQEEVDATGSVSNKGYDITTDMENGTFEYDLTLPRIDNASQIVYAENRSELMTDLKEIDNIIVNEGSLLKVEDLDHFTILIVAGQIKTKISATISGQNKVTVQPNTVLTVSVTATTTGSNTDNNWYSTQYQIGSDSWECVNTGDHFRSGTYTESFDIIAPSNVGVYNLNLRAFNGNNCSGGSSGVSSMANAITVIPVPSGFVSPTLPNNDGDTYKLTSTSGIWTSTNGGGNVSGVGTQEVKWGTSTSGNNRSGLRFENSGEQTFNENDTFYLGALTHFNYPISNAASGATLKITLDFDRPDITNQEFSFNFNIDETTNNNGTCPSWQQTNTPCDDKITFPNSYGTTSFTIGDTFYTLKIVGFVSSYPSGLPVSEFITEESKTSTAYLVGQLSSVLVEKPAIKITKFVNNENADTTPGVYVGVGDTVTFKYVVQNIGNVALTDVTVTDNKISSVSCPQTTLAAGATMECTASGVAVKGQYTNTGTVVGTHSGGTVTNNDSANYYGLGKGTLKVNKVTNLSEDITSFEITGSGTPMVTGAPTFIGDSTGSITSASSKTFNVYEGTYNVSETVPDGWVQTGNTCTNISIANGQNKECTITNTKYGSLTIIKNASPSSTQEFSFTTTGTGLSNFKLVDNSDDGNPSKEFTDLLPGTYNVSETLPDGWYLENATCNDQSSVNAIVLSAGENITCTFKNIKYGSISGHKYMDASGEFESPNTDITAIPGWTIFIDANGNNTFDDGELSAITGADGSYSFKNLTPGTYKVVESMQVGWVHLIVDSQDVTIGAGDDKTNIDFINVKKPTIQVIKKVDTDGDGIIDITNATDWNWKIGSDSYKTGIDPVSILPGTYTISEVQKDNYHATSLVCVKGDSTIYTGVSESTDITLKSGDDVVCTFTNTRNTGTLIVKKVVKNDNGGTLGAKDFSFKINDGTAIQFETDGQNEFTEYAGLPYDILEVNPNTRGYTTSYHNCEDVLVPYGDSATCTITNNDIAPELTVIKNVINGGNDGIKSASDFAITVTGTNVSNSNFQGSENGVTVTLNAGSYKVTEDEDTENYTASYDNCEGTINIGEKKTCTITNTGIDHLPSIEVTKEADKTSVDETGENVIFTFTVKNTSKVDTVTILSLVDSDFGVLAGDNYCKIGTELAPNTSCSFTHTELIKGDASGPNHENTFTATVKDEEGNETSDDDNQTITFKDVEPTLEVTKTVDDNSIPETGQEVTFTFTVKNTSEESVTITSLSDDVFTTLTGSESCKVGTELSAGGSCSFTYTTTLTGDASGFAHKNTFTVTVKDNDGSSVTDSDDATVEFEDVKPTVEVTKDADKSSIDETGESVTFTFTVKNTSEEKVTITTLTDSVFGVLAEDDDCKVGTILTPNESCSFTLTRTISGDYSGPSHKNIFTAVVTDNDNTTATDTDDETITFKDVLPSVEVTKTAGVTEIPETGGNVTFTYKVTNTGLEKVEITSLYDDQFGVLAGDDDCKVGTTLGAGESCESQATFVIPANTPGDPNAATSHKNIFTAVVKDNDGNKEDDDDDEVVTLTPVPSLKLVKNVVHQYNSDTSITANDWTLYANGDGGFSYAGNTDVYKFVKAGVDYALSESDTHSGQFEASAWTCTGGELTGSVLKLQAEDDVVCTITNTALPATIKIYKDVVDGSTNIYSNDIFKVRIVDGGDEKEIRDTEENPLVAVFENLDAGTYNPEEVDIPNGYVSLGCEADKNTVGNGETLEFVCKNEVIDPLLEIEKSNDKQHIDQYAGDEVTYTITVTAPDDEAEGTYVLNNVVVFDIAPAGFKYLSGTWTAQKNGVNIPVPEPTYDDKGQAKWDIGDMKERDVVVLTYKTKISLLQNPGNYPDIAWVSGKSIIDGDVLGASTVDPLTPFVGTDVTVIEPVETEEGEVLGASITLPVTGASTYLTLGALIMMILGVITLLLKPFKKLSYALLTGLMAVSFVSLLTPNRVLALDSDIKVRIMQPATPTNKSSFNVGFVALDLNNNSITVECYKDAEVTPFATFIANTGNCPVTVSASGTYTFFVKAKSASGEQKSADVTVVVDLEKPAPVIDYSKAGNVIKFKTPNDGKTKKVEIHRSTTSKYTANEGTRVHTMDVLPNTEYSWTDTTAEAGKTYYYALRTVDALGNVSTIVSDPEVVEVPTVSTSTATTTTTTTAATTGEVAGEKDTAEEGEVAGETDDVLEGEDKEVEKTEDEEEKTDIKETAKKAAGKWYIWVIAIVVIGGVAYYVRRQKRN